MSDARVRAAIEKMEAWLADPIWEPEADALDAWNRDFLEAMGRAEKAPGWDALIERAHGAGRRLEDRIAVLSAEKDKVQAELERQGRGNRALKGYGANVR